MPAYVLNIFLFFCTVNICVTGFRCQLKMHCAIDLNKIKEAKSQMVFSLSPHLQKSVIVRPNDPTKPDQPDPNWVENKNTFRDFATFTCPKFE